MAEIKRKRKAEAVEVNQNPRTLSNQQLRCIERIRKAMTVPKQDNSKSKSQKKAVDKKTPKSKSEKKEGKKAPLKKGKDYKSSEDRSVKEKDRKKVNYQDTKPGGRGPRGEFYTPIIFLFKILLLFLQSLAGTKEFPVGICSQTEA